MKADFSGWATKVGLKCSDGRTIMPNAFQHQDQMVVPLVWQHGHSDPENVLGHVRLENRKEGVYAYAYFNNTPKAKQASELVVHGDIKSLSIWANQLVERSKEVVHGVIREVSLVLSGANPGALIENVTIRHSDGDEQLLDDEAIIFTGLDLEHSDGSTDGEGDDEDEDEGDDLEHAGTDDTTVQDVYDSMTEEQKNVLHYLVGEALASVGGTAAQSGIGEITDDEGLKAVYDGMSDIQKEAVQLLIGEASEGASHDDIDDNNNDTGDGGKEGSGPMKHNVFESGNDEERLVISHEDVAGIVADAMKGGSLKTAVEDYALAHNIDNIEVLFPDARALDGTPEYLKRQTEWVTKLLGACRKSPFSRIKTLSADITMDEARAKGYVKGTLKKEEFFSVSRRTTTPTTIYKKQKLDRDDVVDITDFDVVAWLKGEMRLMLDEELARAVLIGDGRDVSDDDKINEQNIRPIAKDHELFCTTVNVNLGDANSSIQELTDAVVFNRKYYKGTGLPTLFTTETVLAQYLLLKDSLGRRIYTSVAEVASELRVNEIVTVEVLEGDAEVVAVMVNPIDYVLGADRGGEVTMFEDFDIDYNNQKYLIETRCSGALVKLKSAIVFKKVASDHVLVTPTEPTFDPETGVLSITNTTGVTYKNGDTTVNAAGSPYAAIDPGESITITATANDGYYFASSEVDSWTYTRNHA